MHVPSEGPVVLCGKLDAYFLHNRTPPDSGKYNDKSSITQVTLKVQEEQKIWEVQKGNDEGNLGNNN